MGGKLPINIMSNYQIAMRMFQAFMLTISLGTLAMTYYLVATREYDQYNLIIIGIFCVPVVMSAMMATYLLTQKIN